MGFIGGLKKTQEYATLAHEYVPWNAVESRAGDGPEKLRAYADLHWSEAASRNIKIIPRVFLEWPRPGGTNYWPVDSYWPNDLPRDFASAQFKERAVRMIAKMGEAWDNDPRIAFVEAGLIGPWGEQHHPSPDREMQRALGDAFKAAFKHKLVMNRYPWEFEDYDFGIYWDSFGNPGSEMRKHVPELEGRLADRWRIAPMAGEMSFSVLPKPVPRLAPNPTAAVAEHADTLIRYIRRWHWTALGWVSGYDARDPAAAGGAARVQEAFGYRFVILEVRYTALVAPGTDFQVNFEIQNQGVAPMYYNWPVEVSLLDVKSHAPVWKAQFDDIDIRSWLPGTFSDVGRGRPLGDQTHTRFEWGTGLEYDVLARTNHVSGHFKLPADLPLGEYILALAILDPAGNLPSARFAIMNYFNGGRHPMGIIGVGRPAIKAELDDSTFDDPALDHSLRYLGPAILDLPR